MAINDRLTNSPSPIYGIPRGFTIADIGGGGISQPITGLVAAAANIKSAILPLAVRSLELDVLMSNPAGTCTVNVYTSADAYAAPVFTRNLKGTGTVYIGNFENVDLNGLGVQIEIANLSASNNVTITYRKTS